MCGILVYTAGDNTERLQYLKDQIKKRGPDYYSQVNTENLVFSSSVLGLRDPFTRQPLVLKDRILCFNGQIYNIEGNDTVWFHNSLEGNGPAAAASIDGEFAFAWFDGKDIWFARDSIGRRSLLFSLENNHLTICSVGSSSFTECEAGTLYRYAQNCELTIHSTKSVVPVAINGQPASTKYLLELLTKSVEARMVRPSGHGSLAVLFSGGLDCTVIARIMDIVLPVNVMIELLNVAFENKRTGARFDTPDRTLAIRSHKELSRLSEREFKLIKLDIPYEEATSYYDTVQQLMYPSNTVMDMSIALAFFCAARGPNESRILMSGLGADELFGGYSRHTRAAANGAESLAAELELDFNRLGSRNLGRDDRVCCYWGKEVRYPFLDNKVVQYAANLEVQSKATEYDTKIVLREVARELGLEAVSYEKKRAIQFGAKSAKMDPNSGRAKGTDQLV